MSAQGDALRSAATALETSTMQPWVSGHVEAAMNAVSAMRSAAGKVDAVAALNLPGVSAILG